MAGILKQEAQRLLANVPEACVFRCSNGVVLHNMKELANELEAMTEDTYASHANAQKNDFITWAMDVLKDERLAKDLRKSPGRTAAAEVAANRIALLTKRLG